MTKISTENTTHSIKPAVYISRGFKALGVLVVCSALLASCTEGPTGVHPGHELEVSYNAGISGTKKTIKRAEVMVSGDSVVMQCLPMRSDTIVPGMILFDVNENGVGINSAEMSIRFEKLPTQPGTFAWTSAKATASGGATVVRGMALNIEYGTFYGIEGTTVITEVRKDASGNITGLSGYLNGTLKSVWPKGFNSGLGTVVPPGFDISNPTFMGEELTLHSCPFYTRSNSNVPVQVVTE